MTPSYTTLVGILFSGEDIKYCQYLTKLPTLSLDQRKHLIKACRAQYLPSKTSHSEIAEQVSSLFDLPTRLDDLNDESLFPSFRPTSLN
jgi:hypothetical protein